MITCTPVAQIHINNYANTVNKILEKSKCRQITLREHMIGNDIPLKTPKNNNKFWLIFHYERPFFECAFKAQSNLAHK